MNIPFHIVKLPGGIGAANDVIIGCITHEQKIIAFFATSQKEIWAVLKGIRR
jgi:hypothetical protein